MKIKKQYRPMLGGLLLSIFTTAVNAEVVTYFFSGRFDVSGSMFNAGDRFSGSYSFETTAPVVDLTADGDISTDLRSDAIDPGLPGTGWTLTVFSSRIPGFTISGDRGQIHLGNDTSAFVIDRYIVTLFSDQPLPGGFSDYFFQIDLFDSSTGGADIIDRGDLEAVPNLAAAETSVGALRNDDETSGCTDCIATLDALRRSTLAAPPECDIRLSQPLYVDGETLTADVLRLAKPSGDPVAIELKIWLELSGIPPVSLVNLGADGSFVLAPGNDIELGPLPLLPVNASLPRGDYEFSCRMLEPVTGELLWEDRNPFEVR